MSATATLCTASIAIATISGGLFVQAAPSLNAGVKQLELVDDYIVVHSPTTTTPPAALERSYIVAPPAPDPTVATTAAPPPVAPVAPKVQQVVPAPEVLSTPDEVSVAAAEPMEPTRSGPPTTDAPSRERTRFGDRHRDDEHEHEDEHEDDHESDEGGGD